MGPPIVDSTKPFAPERTSTRPLRREARKSGVPSPLTSPSDASRSPIHSPSAPLFCHTADAAGGRLGLINHTRPAEPATIGSLTSSWIGPVPNGRSSARAEPKRVNGSPLNVRTVLPLAPFRIDTRPTSMFGAPTAISLRPSPLMSPIATRDVPQRWPAAPSRVHSTAPVAPLIAATCPESTPPKSAFGDATT